MCTVTYIPSDNQVYITSNRDEWHHRKPALPPASYTISNGMIYYPKDGNSGGTWFATHENGTTVVLLNGAFDAHISKSNYKKSRGLILLELMANACVKTAFLEINLTNIEPFTLIIYNFKNLIECRWDGALKHSKVLDKTLPHIWSSATLYDKSAIKKREDWFNHWLNNQKEITQNSILNFHKNTGDGDTHNSLLMNRNDKVFTVSVTSVAYINNIVQMQYWDAFSNENNITKISLATEVAQAHE